MRVGQSLQHDATFNGSLEQNVRHHHISISPPNPTRQSPHVIDAETVVTRALGASGHGASLSNPDDACKGKVFFFLSWPRGTLILGQSTVWVVAGGDFFCFPPGSSRSCAAMTLPRRGGRRWYMPAAASSHHHRLRPRGLSLVSFAHSRERREKPPATPKKRDGVQISSFHIQSSSASSCASSTIGIG